MDISSTEGTQFGCSFTAVLRINPLYFFLLDIAANCSDLVALMEVLGHLQKSLVGVM